MDKLKHAFHAICELMLRFSVAPRLRARLLSLLGAKIGRNVRIYECRFINLHQGFRNLVVSDDVHIGIDCLLDLQGPVFIGLGTTISPRVNLISHNDPGSFQQTPLLDRFPVDANGVTIGSYCWLGTGATVLSGSKIGDRTVIGAMSLVRGLVPGNAVYVGVPARPTKAGLKLSELN